MTEIKIPELALVVLVGISGSGKSTLARRLFKPTEILSSDTFRGLVSDDENNQAATADAFDALYYLARKRLARGLVTVVDATNVQADDRKALIQLAREYHCLPVAIVLDLPESVCIQRNKDRQDRQLSPRVIRSQRQALRSGLSTLQRSGFRHVFILRTPEECAEVTLHRDPLWNNRKHETGPFDIIGDVHGCYQELLDLLGKLGWTILPVSGQPDGVCEVTPPEGPDSPRKLVFLGDLVDRGPATPAVLRFVMAQVQAGRALCVPGNHDHKLMKALRGAQVQAKHGLAESLEQLSRESEEFRQSVIGFIDDLVSHYVLDGGRLVVAHAGLPESMQGRGSGAVRAFAMYGETTGESDEFGLPVRYNWAAEYRGKATVVYGHTPVLEPDWLNNTLCIDTGCVFGGTLTALRWPEREIHSVPAHRVYAESRKPLQPPSPQTELSLQHQNDDRLHLEDISGKRHILTQLARTVIIREENASAAMEIMSRFAVDPHWLIYLPPTMSPCETSELPGILEYPSQALDYYRTKGVSQVICEEKHMGSRAVVVVCRDQTVATRRFGILSDQGEQPLGVIYTRTGRPFFTNPDEEQQVLARINQAVQRAGLYDDLQTDWLCLDCEIMPWSAKAQALIRDQYATVGVAATVGLEASRQVLDQAALRLPEAAALAQRQSNRLTLAHRYVAAYQRYCWPVQSLDDYRIAPFHLLASESGVHTNRDHIWHMNTLARLAAVDEPMIMATPHRIVDFSNQESVDQAIQWWLDLTSQGGEGMVVKPLDFVPIGSKGPLQPAIKVRGPEYLRIIYGPEYDLPEHQERLRSRGLSAKRSLALREFALGLEALNRFHQREPLRRVHECVFGVLALESEPVDPRL